MHLSKDTEYYVYQLEVDQYIAMAMFYANNYWREHKSWDRAFHYYMDKVTEESGIRFLEKGRRIMRQKG